MVTSRKQRKVKAIRGEYDDEPVTAFGGLPLWRQRRDRWDCKGR